MLLRSVAGAFTRLCGDSISRSRGQRRVMRRQPAYPVALDLQRTIESRAHILHRHSRGQIDDLLGVEVALQFLENLVGNVDRAQRHFLGIAQRGALGQRKQWILDVVRDRGEFIFAYSNLTATGSVDIYSEDAADHLRGAQADQPLQARVGNLGGFDRLGKNRHRKRQPRAISPRLVRIQHLAESPLHHPGQRPQYPTDLFIFETFDTHCWNAPITQRVPQRGGFHQIENTD